MKLLAALLLASCATEDASFTEADQEVITSPAIGGPYASGGTTNTGAVITTAAAALPFMDRAASNWGCDWNMSANPVVAVAGGFSKAYGTMGNTSQGCGFVYWNTAKQSAYFVAVAGGGANVASSKFGATVTTSPSFSAGTPASSIIDGNRKGTVWGSGGGWSSATPASVQAPQTVTVAFNQLRTINAVEVVTLQDNYGNAIEPTSTTTFANYGIRDFTIDALVNGVWTSVGSATGNDRVWRRFTTLSPINATHIRLTITKAADSYARVIELSAYDASPAIVPSQLWARYAQLGASGGILGSPISNPAPYTGNGVSYQLFENGVMTFKRGNASAFFVGGVTPPNLVTGAPAFDDRPLAAAWQRMFNAYPTSNGTPLAYALASDAGCTAPSPANPTLCSSSTTGRFVRYSDDYWNGGGYFVAKLGGPASAISVPIASQLTTGYPWLSDLGFPTADIANIGSTARYQKQLFENGSLLWRPGYDVNGTETPCPDPIASCTGAFGQTGCPVRYGTRYTNYVVKRNESAPSCSTYGTVEGDPLNPLLGAVQYYLPPGTSQDFTLGTFQAGTTLEFGNCDGPQTSPGISLQVLNNGVQVSSTTSGCSSTGRVYSTFSSRLGTENWTVRLTCPGNGGSTPCASVAHFNKRYDFNGDLISVRRAYDEIPNTSMGASVLGMLDTEGAFTDEYYTCTNKQDHPEGVVRLPGNRFAVTTDFGSSGRLYLFKIGSKAVDDAHRLGTNVTSNQVPANDAMFCYDTPEGDHLCSNDILGEGRGHLGGATRSGTYLLTASETDDHYDNGMINVIDAADDTLPSVNHYTNLAKLGTNDGAAWVTSAKLGTGSPDRGAINYIPPELRNAHLVLSAGTDMTNINAVYAPRDQGGLSLLTGHGKGPGDNFQFFATMPGTGGDNQATLLTQADGQVFLMTLNGDASSGIDDSTYAFSKLYKVSFFGCPNNAKICLQGTGGEQNLSYRKFQTTPGGDDDDVPYADLARAAGTWIHATGDWSETLMVYGLWPTKVNSTRGYGCDDDTRGPWLRMMEF